MSKQDVENFLKQLTDDITLREQLSAKLANAEDSAIGETVIDFATEVGFDINADDLEWLNNALSEDALSDEALDSVTGGSFLTDAGRSLKDWFLPHRISKDEKKNPWNHP